jgi:hypothetical protein
MLFSKLKIVLVKSQPSGVAGRERHVVPLHLRLCPLQRDDMIADIDCTAKDQTGRSIYRTCRSCNRAKGKSNWFGCHQGPNWPTQILAHMTQLNGFMGTLYGSKASMQHTPSTAAETNACSCSTRPEHSAALLLCNVHLHKEKKSLFSIDWLKRSY